MEKERIEKELRESEERYRRAIESSNDGIALVEQGRFVCANQRFLEIFGLEEPEAIMGRPVSALVRRNDGGAHDLDALVQNDGEGSKRFEFENFRKDGQVFLLEASVSRITYHGEVLYVMYLNDITKRRIAAEALLESGKRYRGLFENLPDGFASIGMNKFFIEANASLQAMLGYTQEELRCLSYEDLTPEKWRNFEDRIVEGQVLTRGYSDVYEKEYVKRDDTVFPVEVRAHLLRDERGNPTEMCSFVRDVTRRKQSEEALKEAEEQYRTIVQLSPAGILIHVDGKIEFVNPALARMLGVARQEELRGKPIRGFVHPDYRDLVEERTRRITLDGKRAPLIEEKFLRADRADIDVEVTSFPFKHKGRDAIMALVEDITLRKSAEEALRRRERELEEKSSNLEDANTAMKVLLRHQEEEKRTVESTMLANIKELVFPYLDKLRGGNLTQGQVKCLAMIESNLNEVISPFLRKMTAIYVNFTPMEIQIANLIKSGRTSKEIAEILKVGTGTVHTHRNNIRNKLGVRNKDVNLRSYLLSLRE